MTKLTRGQREKRCWQCGLYWRNKQGQCPGGQKGCIFFKKWEPQTKPKKPISFVLTHYWFDQIEAGHKLVEYRTATPYWQKRLKAVKPGDTVVFRRGYTNTTITAVIVKITPYGYSALPQDVKDFMVGVQWGDLFYAIEFKLFKAVEYGK